MNERALTAMLAPLRRKLAMMAARAVVRLVDNSKARQLVQAEILKGELRDRVERFQNYGFRSYPFPGSDAVVLSVGGSREQAIVVVVDDRRYTLELVEGEVAMYDDQGQYVAIKRGKVAISSGTEVTIDAPAVNVTGETSITGNTTITGDTSTSGNHSTGGNASVAGDSEVAGSIAAGGPVTSGGDPLATVPVVAEMIAAAGTGGGTGGDTNWGDIGGSLVDQTDLAAVLAGLVAADAALGGEIDSEAADRADADTALGTAIAGEAATRAADDATETASRIAADDALGTAILAEATARAAADTTIAAAAAAAQNTANSKVAKAGDTMTGPLVFIIPGTTTTNPVSITGTFTGNGRLVQWRNDSVAADSTMGLFLSAGTGGGTRMVDCADEYTAVAAFASRGVFENMGVGGLAISAQSATGDIRFFTGVARTLKMTLANDGTLTLVGTIVASNIGTAAAAALDTDAALAANSDTRVPSQKAVKAYVAASVAGTIASVTEATTARVAAIADNGRPVEFTNAAASTYTIQAYATVALPVGAIIPAIQGSTGQVTFVAGAGVTFETSDSYKTRKQGAFVAMEHISLNRWKALGDLETAETPRLFAAASGTADIITATFSPAPTLADGLEFRVRASAANTATSPTFNPNGLGALTIYKFGGQALAAGDIYGAGHEVILRYRASPARFELMNPAASGTGGSGGSSSSGANTLTQKSATLATNQAIATTAETDVTGVSVVLTPGTWLVHAVAVMGSDVTSSPFMRVTDGTNYFGGAQASLQAGYDGTFVVTEFVTVTVDTTIKMVACSQVGGVTTTLYAQPTGSGKGYATKLRAVKISDVGGNAGGFTLAVPRVTLASAGNTITVPGLKLSEAAEYQIRLVLKNNGAVGGNYSMFVNGDSTAANYRRQILLGDGGTAVGERGNDGLIGTLSASGHAIAFIGMRRDVDGRPRAQIDTMRGNLADLATAQWSWVHDDVTDVTSLSIVCAQNMAAGSYVEVYKLGGNSYVITPWQSEALTITGATSNPTKGSTLNNDKIWWRRVGDSMECRVDYDQASAGTAGSGAYRITIPNGKTIDTTKARLNSTINVRASVGSGVLTDNVTYTSYVYVAPVSTNQLHIGDIVAGHIGSANKPMSATNWILALTFTVPILEWAS